MVRSTMVLFLFVPAMAHADEDLIKAELDKARARYTESLEAAKGKLVVALDAKLKEVAGKGDLDAAKDLKSQKESFEKEGALPGSPFTARARADYDAGVRAAHDLLRKALEKAKTDYTKAIKLEQAEAVAAELKDFASAAPVPRGPAPASKTKRSAATEAEGKRKPVGPIAEGAVYAGSFVTGAPTKGGGLKDVFSDAFTLVIESIDGPNFVGKWTWADKHITQVEGTINRNGQIAFKYTKNIVGKSVTVGAGAAAGTINPKRLECTYIRPNENRIGKIEGQIKSGE